MGKIKTVVMGDLEAEEKTREKERVKREQKKKTKETKISDKIQIELGESESENTGLSETSDTAGKLNSIRVPSEKKKKTKLNNKYSFPKGKKYINSSSLVDKSKTYSLAEALDLVKKTSFSKFDGSVELHLNVTDKGLRGTVALPHGTGKQVRVAIADDALITSISSGGSITFDILVSAPDMMPKLAKVAKILGPKGLMPNPKTGTIGPDPEKLAKQLSAGQVQWKTQNDFPIIHTVIGKVSFDSQRLEENYQALVKSIGRDKIKSAFLKPTMGPSVKIQL